MILRNLIGSLDFRQSDPSEDHFAVHVFGKKVEKSKWQSGPSDLGSLCHTCFWQKSRKIKKAK